MLVVAALALKLLVPTGFMPIAGADGTITVQICSGLAMAPKTMTIAVSGMPGGQGEHRSPASADTPCAFAGLMMPMVAGADPLLLAVAIAFVMAIVASLAPRAWFASPARLRPPLRGPPLPA